MRLFFLSVLVLSLLLACTKQDPEIPAKETTPSATKTPDAVDASKEGKKEAVTPPSSNLVSGGTPQKTKTALTPPIPPTQAREETSEEQKQQTLKPEETGGLISDSIHIGQKLSNGHTLYKLLLFISIASNVLLLIVLIVTMKWRTVTKEGMLAVIPTSLADAFASINKTLQIVSLDTGDKLGAIREQLKKHNEIIEILKKENTNKDLEISRFKSGMQSEEKNLIVFKTIKLYSFFERLEQKINSGEIKEAAAIGFLREELHDLFDDFSVREISPGLGKSIKEFSSEQVKVRDTIVVTSPELHAKVALVHEVGYEYPIGDGKYKVIRPAIVTLNSFGG